MKCSARGHLCPGYGDVFDKSHRDETIKIRARHSPLSHKITAARKLSKQEFITMQRQNCPPLPKNISPNAEYNALTWFFLYYNRSYDIEETCSFFGVLPDLYVKSAMSSPLNRAVTALALQVTNLHNFHGNEPSMGHDIYAESIIQTKDALSLPGQSKSDEMLMTTLVLEAYESVSATFVRRRHSASRSCTHLRGSIALLRHRGAINYRDKLSWSLVAATRNRLLQHAWQNTDELIGIETIHDIWDCGGEVKPQGPAVEADTLAFKLSRLWLLDRKLLANSPPRDRKKVHSVPVVTNGIDQLQDILSQAICLANECAIWHTALPSSWRSVSVQASTLPASIRATSVYENAAPTIYAKLSIANSKNRQRITELRCLSLIGSCLARIALPDDRLQDRGHCGNFPTPLARAQVLVDEICASVSFLTGNRTAGGSNTRAVLVPSLVQTSSDGHHRKYTFPRDIREHAEQVIASGLYMMYSTLTEVLEMIGDTRTIGMGTILRDGQVRWIMGQVDRLRDVLHIVK